MKRGKLERSLYDIRHLYFDALWRYGKLDKENKVLICDETATNWSGYLFNNGLDTKGDCQLFNQTKKALLGKEDTGKKFFEDIFVNIDFTNVMESPKLSSEMISNLKKIENGIILTIGGKQIRFVDFLKSNSMSKNNCIYYVNAEYKSKIEPRVTFGLDKNKAVIAKWYAYSGLCISDSTIIENIKLNSDEVVVIPDDKDTCKYIKCITAISIKYLLELVQEVKDALADISKYIFADITLPTSSFYENISNLDLKNKKVIYSKFDTKINPIVHEFISYKKSPDFIVSSDTKFTEKEEYMLIIVNRFLDAIDLSIDNCLKELSNITKEYAGLEGNSRELYWKKMLVSNYPIFVNKFDGEGLISKEFSKEINIELNKLANNKIDAKFGFSFQIRLPFIKGVVHSCDIKKFFKDKNIEKIYGLDFSGGLKEYEIDKVKMILTKGQFKADSMLKGLETLENESAFDAFMRKFKEYDYAFAISNLEPENKDTVNLNYQFFSTLPFATRELKKLLHNTENEFKILTTDENVAKSLFLQHSSECEQDEKIYAKNPDFYISTKRFKLRKAQIIADYLRELLQMKINCNGYRKLLCGDLLELLYHAAHHHLDKKDRPICPKLPLNKFYAPNTVIENEDSFDKCILLRNPHYSRNEIAVLKPYTEEGEHQKYFGTLTGVLMVNPLSLTAERLGGADYDGDTVVLLTHKLRNRTIANLTSKDNKLKYPLIQIPSLLVNPLEITYENKIICLKNTFSSRVGLISNNALNDAFKIYSFKDVEKEDQIAFYTILNGLEIDSAKKGIKPIFFQTPKSQCCRNFLELKDKLKADAPYDKQLKEFLYFNKLYNYKDDLLNIQSAIHYIGDQINGFKPVKSKEEKFKFKKENLDVSDDAISKMITILRAYSIVTTAINQCSHKAYNKKLNGPKEKAIQDSIYSILELNNIADDEIINALHTTNAYETLKRYCSSEEKYHYLDSKGQREVYLKNYLEIEGLTTKDIDILCEFDKNKVYLVYLILRYWKEFEAVNGNDILFKKPICNEILNDESIIYKRIEKNLTQETIDNIIVKSNVLVEKISDELVEICKCKNYIKVLKDKTLTILKPYVKDIPFEAFIKVTNIDNYDLAFNLLSDKLLVFLDKIKEEK